MALPESRDFDAVDSGNLPAATVNNLQDSIVNRSHGAVWIPYGNYNAYPEVGNAPTLVHGSPDLPIYDWTATADALIIPIDFPPGTKIIQIDAWGKITDFLDSMSVDLWYRDFGVASGVAETQVNTGTGGALSAGPKDEAFTPIGPDDHGLPHTMLADKRYHLKIVSSNFVTEHKFAGGRIQIVKP